MVNKGLLTIGEFSRLTGIPRSKLIYYDEIGLFPAVKRGDNNYRYYSLTQIIFSGFINDMTSFGVSLKELLPLAQERTPEDMIVVLEKMIKEHQDKITSLRETQSIMGVMSGLMKLGLKAEQAEIQIEDYEPHNLVLGSENVHQEAVSFYPAWLTFMKSAKKAGVNIMYPVGGYFDSMERFCTNPDMPSRYYFVNPRGKSVRSGGKWLAGYVRGFYGNTNDLSQNMIEYAKENSLRLTGPVYNTFLLDEISTIDPDRYLMRASVKIAAN